MIDLSSNGVLLVFAKIPVPGQVKTRLIPELGVAGATDLYRKMLFHTLDTATGTGVPVELWCTPGLGHPDIVDCRQKYRLDVHIQCGHDLGERMYFSFEKALERYTFAVLIGCDCPGITADDLKQAFTWLESGSDAVLGPAQDGGYYLIGLRCNHRSLFSGIEWDSDGVAGSTRSRLKDLGWCWDELPVRQDVDSPRDLERLQEIFSSL